MKPIITVDEAQELGEILSREQKRIVVAGGCFDILHAGHIRFLQAAKNEGDVLILLLENDRKIQEMKGIRRPINTQEDRAEILAALKMVDYVITLPYTQTNNVYDALLHFLKPAIIATTKGDPNRSHKERQSALVHATVKDVIAYQEPYATSAIIKKVQS